MTFRLGPTVYLWSHEAASRRRPERSKSIALVGWSARRSAIFAPVSSWNRETVPASVAIAIRRPSALNFASEMTPPGTEIRYSTFPVCTFHAVAVQA
jgi:hypothetical protein